MTKINIGRIFKPVEKLARQTASSVYNRAGQAFGGVARDFASNVGVRRLQKNAVKRVAARRAAASAPPTPATRSPPAGSLNAQRNRQRRAAAAVARAAQANRIATPVPTIATLSPLPVATPVTSGTGVRRSNFSVRRKTTSLGSAPHAPADTNAGNILGNPQNVRGDYFPKSISNLVVGRGFVPLGRTMY